VPSSALLRANALSGRPWFCGRCVRKWHKTTWRDVRVASVMQSRAGTGVNRRTKHPDAVMKMLEPFKTEVTSMPSQPRDLADRISSTKSP